ncbi:Glycosyltransferase involved in cell wall bisynthesis [Chryseobacterium taichungense]|uniref:Glycosyltransferase involved in cell wall bisynthesis n=1 Tax=Chryseobacterium taichungense TaxID=295069 RepID=A0A1H7YCA0_9FLAO|nr:glycosyltransferase [Chryseobacterium taichungense]SEM43846.1 Glycosyltransferase involved in cell wall bisynthesis [Chryseobacterium taichungense]
MKLSIIIPIYNIEKYVSKCLDSILNQDFIDYEIILIDDGSTDNSLSLCKEYEIKHPNIQLFSQENQGVSVARNNGISKSNGQWLCFIDGDDFIEKESLSNIFNQVNDFELDCIIAKSYINNGNKRLNEKYKFNSSFLKKTFTGNELAFQKQYLRGSVCGAFFKRSFIIQNNIQFPIGLINGEDTIFFTKCMLYFKKVIFFDEIFYFIYERHGSASRKWDQDKILLMINNIKYINNYKKLKQLNKSEISLLDYAIYRIISSIFNNLSKCFTIGGFCNIYKSIKQVLNYKLDVGEIKLSHKKVKLLQTSLLLFGISVIVKNYRKKLKCS